MTREQKTHTHEFGNEGDEFSRTFSTGDVVWVVVDVCHRIAIVLDPCFKAGVDNARKDSLWLGNILVLEGLQIKTYHPRWLEH